MINQISDEKIILNNNTFNILWQSKKTKPEVFYSCQRCGELYASKIGAKEHICQSRYAIQNFNIVDIPPISVSESMSKTNSENYALIIEKLIRFVCVSNIPLRALDNIYLRSALHILNDKFDYPLRQTMAKRIKQFADICKDKTYEKLANKKLSLLFDSAKKWSKDYQAVICYTHDDLFLIKLDITQNNTAAAITPLIVNIIQKFEEYNSIVIAICTDSDNTNKSVFDPDKGVVQKLTNDNFIRQPCCAHIANLAIEDMFLRKEEYYYIYKYIHKILLKANPHNLKKAGFPHIQTIRWNSLYHCVKYILDHKNLINFQDEKVQKYFEIIESNVTWKNLLNILETANNFITLIEEDQANLADMMNAFIYTYRQLSGNHSKESECLAQCFLDRFWNDCTLQLPAFAFLLTKDGLIYISKAPEDEKKVFIEYAIDGLQNYMEKRKLSNFETVLSLFNNYLENLPIDWFSDDLSPYENWEQIHNDFGIIACEVFTIPCTEAAVERLYSYLSSITSSSMYNSSLEMIESRLMIHIDSILI